MSRSATKRKQAVAPPTVWAPVGTPLLVGLLALTMFIVTLAPTVTAEDSGELATAAWHFGIAHPPGYPLWTILCGIFMRLIPIGSVAYRANLFSAVCSAAAAVIAYAAIRELGISRSLALGVSLVWVWSRWSWAQSVITEVYALNSLITVGILWCGLRWHRTRNGRLLVLASLLLGLGMSNHHSIALAGLAVAAWILIQEPSLLKRGRLVLASVGAFSVGLLPYVYLPIRASANPVINWGDPATPAQFWEHVTRHQYGAVGPMKTAQPRSLRRLALQTRYLIEAASDDLTAWLTGAAVIGSAMMLVGQRRLLLLVVLWIVSTGLVFAVLANYDLDRTSRWAMRVFLIPVPLGLMIPLALLLERLAGLARRVGGDRSGLRAIATAMLAIGGPAVQVAAHWKQCDYSNYWYAYDHGRNLLDCMLPNAMVFPSGDHSTFPLAYLVLVEGRRPDVLIADIYGYVSPQLYADRPKESKDDPAAWLIKYARRPVYYATKQSPPVDNARFVTAALLYHLLPDGMPFDDQGLLEACTYRNIDAPSIVDFGASHILTDFEFFHGLHDLERGRTEEAIAHFDRATELCSGIKEVYNNVGSALAEHGVPEKAIKYFREAALLDPHYALPRWNLFRLLKSEGLWDDARRQLEEVIAADPEDYRAHGEMGFLLDRQLNDRPGALNYWHASLRLNPSQPEILRALNRQADGN